MDRATFKTISFGILGALFLLAPQALHELYDSRVPFLWWFISNGAVYVKVFFHELGHAFFYYFYGHLGLPMLLSGGGLTIATEQFIPLALGMSVLLFYTTRLNRDNGFWFWLVACLLVFQLATFFTDFHESVIGFMGHGTEIILGGYMLYRALLDLARNSIERYANALFGFFMIFFNLYQGWGIAFVPAIRESYTVSCAMLPGISMADFVRISESLNISLHMVALFSFGCALVALIVPFILWEHDEDWYEESEEKFPGPPSPDF